MTDCCDRATIAAVEFRDELLEKGWPDDHEVAELAETHGREATTYAIRAQASGDLLGVRSMPRHRFIYPDFQFDCSDSTRKDVAGLLAVLHK